MKVKIELDENQTKEEAEELLYKALNSHRLGSTHTGDTFQDPVMEHLLQTMRSNYRELYDSMLSDIFKALDEEDV